MKVYNYNKDTKEYISTTQATENPLEKGKYLIPANATTIAISVDKAGFAQTFDEVKNTWDYIEDNRDKTVYDTTSKQESKVDYIGAIKSGFTELIPKITNKWDGTKWIFDIVSASTAKLSELKTAYNTTNEADIAYMNTTFQAGKSSQDLIVSVLSAGSVPSNFYWLDSSNVQVAMTYANLQGLSAIIVARGQVNFTKLQNLKSQIKSAKVQSDLDKIVW